MTKIPPSERIKQETEAFLRDGLTGEVNVLGTLLKLGAQRLIQEALEQEVTDFLGREHYERNQQGQEHRGFRNGWKGSENPVDDYFGRRAGLIRAIEEVFPKSLRVRCWAHKMRNVLDKVPEEIRNDLKAHLQALRDATNLQEGRRIGEEVLAIYKDKYPAAMRSLADDLEASLAHLMVPVAHRKFVRTTNLIERSFVEERRRTKVIPYFRTGKSCTKLVYATLLRASLRWQRIRISSLEHKQLRTLAIQLGIAHAEAATEINGQIVSVTA